MLDPLVATPTIPSSQRMQNELRKPTSDQGSLDDQRSFLEGAKEQGFLDGITSDTANMEIAVDGMSATAGPVDLEGAFGTLSVTYELEKRDGRWLIVSGTQG